MSVVHLRRCPLLVVVTRFIASRPKPRRRSSCVMRRKSCGVAFVDTEGGADRPHGPVQRETPEQTGSLIIQLGQQVCAGAGQPDAMRLRVLGAGPTERRRPARRARSTSRPRCARGACGDFTRTLAREQDQLQRGASQQPDCRTRSRTSAFRCPTTRVRAAWFCAGRPACRDCLSPISSRIAQEKIAEADANTWFASTGAAMAATAALTSAREISAAGSLPHRGSQLLATSYSACFQLLFSSWRAARRTGRPVPRTCLWLRAALRSATGSLPSAT